MKLKAISPQFSSLVLVTLAMILGGCTITDITSSTSSTLDTVTPDVTLNRFVDTRIASLQQEAAGGSGENLDALAHLLGQPDRTEFAGWMQGHYDELFTDLNQPADLITRIKLMQARAQI